MVQVFNTLKQAVVKHGTSTTNSKVDVSRIKSQV